MTAYDDLLAKLHNGFRLPQGQGRCVRCGCHIAKQGHRDGCPNSLRGR